MINEEIAVFGLGQCGARIGKEFESAGVQVCYANSDEVDFRGLEAAKESLLLLERSGTGGSPFKGTQIFKEHKDQFYKFFTSNFDKSKITLFICGLGGGTGSGFIIPAVEYAIEQGYKVGCIATMPPKMLGLLSMTNALKTLKELKRFDLKPFILADNEHLISILGIDKNWWLNVNKYIVANLLYIFDIVRSNKITQTSFGSIDRGEILRIFQYGKGLLDVRTSLFTNNELDTLTIKEIKSSIFGDKDNGFKNNLMPRFNYKDTLAYLLNIDVPAKGNYNNVVSHIFSITKSVCGSSISRLGMFLDPELKDNIRVTMVNAGLKLPKILQSSMNNLKRDEHRFKTKMEKDDAINLEEFKSDLIDDDFDL
jgi:cell division GTPase FtsZ